MGSNAAVGAFIDVFASGTNANPMYLAFAPAAVPEPPSLALLSLGGIGAGIRDEGAVGAFGLPRP
jgi:hypothetical protein